MSIHHGKGKLQACFQEGLSRGIGFRPGHQPGFANPYFAADQSHLPSPTFCLINELVEGGQIGCAPD